MPVPLTAPAVAAAKTAMRKRHLHELRAWAKSHPEELQAQSQALCDSLFCYVEEEYLSSGPRKGSTAAPDAKRPHLYICSYLPLYYEVDMMPFMEKVWALQQKARDGAPPVMATVMVPVVMEPPRRRRKDPAPALLGDERGAAAVAADPQADKEDFQALQEWHKPHETAADRLASALVFVEVRDAADLRTSFETKGKYHIRELKDATLLRLFQSKPKSPRQLREKEKLQETDTEEDSHVPRRVLCCEEWESLFPQHEAPPGLVRLSGVASTPTAEQKTLFSTTAPMPPARPPSILVLAPGVCFSRTTGARLGKGGGFYDRFLTHLDKNLRRRDAAAVGGDERETKETADATCGTVEVIGVAFNSQVMEGELAVDPAMDAPVDSIFTPTQRLELAPADYR